MTKVLMLGSDYGSQEIIRELQRRNCYVIVADYYEETPAKSLADESWLISTSDIDQLVEACTHAGIEAVITGASDFNGGNARKLCKRLNLPIYCSNDSAWEAATNKSRFKQICKKVGAPTAKSYSLDDYLTDRDGYNIDFPIVVKPVDMSANRGMSYCNNKKELDNAIDYAHSISKSHELILEKKLEGPEYAVNYIIANGEPRLFFFSAEHHQPGELANLYSIITTTNYHLDQYKREVDPYVVKVFKEAGLTEGVAWVECMLNKDSHFYLLEMGYRFGGEVVNIPYKDVSGFDSLNWMIDCELGIAHTEADLPKPIQKFSSIATSYMLFATKEGIISKVEGIDEVTKIPGIKVDIIKTSGKKVKKYLTLGVIRIYSQDCNELCQKISTINDCLKFIDTQGEDILLRFTNFQELLNEYDSGLAEL